MKNCIKLLIITLVALFSPQVAHSMTAEQMLQKAADNFVKSSGLSATYTVMGKNISKQVGTIKMMKDKFTIQHPQLSTWYDGKTQWNYNAKTNEVTLSEPSIEELQSISPYTIISGYSKNFTPTIVKSKIKGTHCISLKAKSKKSEISNVYLYLNSNNYNPMRLDITIDNTITTLVITNYKTNMKFKESDFKFPTSKYNAATIIDLR